MKQTAHGGQSQDAKNSYSFELIENNTIVFCKVRGFITTEFLEKVVEDSQEYVEILRRAEKPTLLLTDTSEVTGMDPSARRSIKFIHEFKVDKSAIYGANPFLTMISQFILKLGKAEKWNRVFQSKSQALRWLKGHEQSHQKLLRLRSARILSLLVMTFGTLLFIDRRWGTSLLQTIGFAEYAIVPAAAMTIVIIGVAILLLSLPKIKRLSHIAVRVIATWLLFIGTVRLLDHWVGIQVIPDLFVVGSAPVDSWRFAIIFILFGLLLWQATLPLIRKLPSTIFRFTMIITILWTFAFLVVDTFNLPFSSRLIIDVVALATEAAIILITYRKPGRFPVARRVLLRYWPGVTAFLVIFAVAIAAWGHTRQQTEQSSLSQTRDKLVSEFEASTEVLRSYRAFFSSSEFVTLDEFQFYTDESGLARYPGITSVIFIDHPTPDSYLPTYQAPSATPWDEYTFVDRPHVRQILDKARDTGEIVSGTTTDFTFNDSGRESIAAIALYQSGVAIPQAIQERASQVRGFIVATFSEQAFLQHFFTTYPVERGVSLIVTNSNNDIMYSTLHSPSEEPAPPVAQSSIQIAGDTWHIQVLKNNFGDGSLWNGPNAFLTAGAIFGLLIGSIVILLMYRRFRTQELVDIITEDLGYEHDRAVSLAQKDEAILKSIGDGIVVTDRIGRVTLTNERFTDMTGWTTEDLIGNQLTDVVPLIDAQGRKLPKSERIITRELFRKAKEPRNIKMIKATLNDKLRYRRKDGTEFPVAITVTPIVVDNKITGAVQVVRDITQEAQIDQAKTDFVALASHQLRTPLTATRWYSELLLDSESGPLNHKQKEYARQMLNGTIRTITLVNALLNTSRIEAGSVRVYTEPTDIAQLLTQIVKTHAEETNARKLRVSEQYQANLPKIQVDPSILQTIIDNLLSNAIKYTPEKGLITLKLHNDSVGILLAITDTGYGIPKAQQDKIFTKIFRADNIRLKTTEGTGLGLYLVKSLAEYTGCKVWFESTENSGSTFYVRIPKKGMERRQGTTELA